MDYTIDDVRHEVQALRHAIYQGDLFNSLRVDVGNLLAALRPGLPTPVAGLTDSDEAALRSLATNLQTQLAQETLTTVATNELLQLVTGLKATEPTVRDDLAMATILDLLQQGILTAEQMQELARYLLRDEMILAHIDEQASDAVFLRSSSVYLLMMIIFTSRQNGGEPLPLELQETLIDTLAVYLVLETDTRGFVDDKGWAHAFFHVALLLDALAEDPSMTRADKIFLLTLLLERVIRLDQPLFAGEFKRLATYMVNLMQMSSFYSDYLLNIFKQWRQAMIKESRPTDTAGWNRFYNQITLLQNLMLKENLPEPIYDYLNEQRHYLS